MLNEDLNVLPYYARTEISYQNGFSSTVLYLQMIHFKLSLPWIFPYIYIVNYNCLSQKFYNYRKSL